MISQIAGRSQEKFRLRNSRLHDRSGNLLNDDVDGGCWNDLSRSIYPIAPETCIGLFLSRSFLSFAGLFLFSNCCTIYFPSILDDWRHLYPYLGYATYFDFDRQPIGPIGLTKKGERASFNISCQEWRLNSRDGRRRRAQAFYRAAARTGCSLHQTTQQGWPASARNHQQHVSDAPI